MVKSENVNELLNQFKTLWEETARTKKYNHSSEISTIAQKLQAMKLNDDFLISSLTEEERSILDNALVIAHL